MEKIHAHMTIAEILNLRPEVIRILVRHGMHCMGCAVSSAESLAAAAQVHQIDLAKLLHELNDEF